jgi:Holliday junction resolvase RusA-like endonuclease
MGGGGVRLYTPAATRAYEKRFAAFARMAANQSGWTIGKDDVVTVEVSVHRKYLLKGGDIDNTVKATIDACNGIFYTDDCRVVSVDATLSISARPRIEFIARRYARKDWAAT